MKASVTMNRNPSINHKLEVLISIAKILNKHHILWHLGASCMLYLRGYVDHFHDIDLMIAEEHVDEVKRLLSKYSHHERQKNEQYKTKVFLEYDIEGVDIDIMAGFAIVHEGQVHEFPLKESDPSDELLLDDTVIYLAKVETWYTYYKLMKREDKIKIIDHHRVS